jgi:hypothetical protein
MKSNTPDCYKCPFDCMEGIKTNVFGKFGFYEKMHFFYSFQFLSDQEKKTCFQNIPSKQIKTTLLVFTKKPIEGWFS